MKKIGIMTWFKHENYGTVLQAYALYKIIENLGYRPFLINYKPKGSNEFYKITYSRIIQEYKKARHTFYKSKNRTLLFEIFLNKEVNTTEKISSLPELKLLNQEFDAFICGSDQIWSPLSFEDKFFLSFVENNNKKIAYAPSLGVEKIDNELIKKQMKKMISRFNHLSVREFQAADLIKELAGKNPEIVLDPTLLLKSSDWDIVLNQSLQNSIKTINGGYVICYFLGDYRKYNKKVKKISKILNLPIYVIPVFQQQKNKVSFDVGPLEFIHLIKNAKYMCTDSYHGLLFAINYNIPFSVFKRFKDRDTKNQNSRIYNILNSTGLQTRLICERDFYSGNKLLQCDFSIANSVLLALRKDSINYLEKALSLATCDKRKNDNNKKGFVITDLCCGCGACATVCSQQALSILQDSNGFEHYRVDDKKCVRCGQCKQVCPFYKIEAKELGSAKSMYSYKSFSEDVLKKSSSGGIGFELAQIYSKKGYWICGSAYLNNLDSATHIIIPPMCETEIYRLQGSKYIQSISSEAIKQITCLKQNEKIVFFGTPCQVAGLDKLLKLHNKRENAVLIDLICHGVPSYLLWSKYLQDIRKKNNIGEHPKVTFRTKKRQWHMRSIKIEDAKRMYEKAENRDDFYAIFRRGLCDMDACYECPYREKTSADIRIGDYWGKRFIHDKQGVSMVITITEEGENVLYDFSERNKAKINRQNLQEYWDIQSPYNQAKPVYYADVIDDLKNPNLAISQIRKKYCSFYDLKEYLQKYYYFIKETRKKK